MRLISDEIEAELRIAAQELDHAARLLEDVVDFLAGRCSLGADMADEAAMSATILGQLAARCEQLVRVEL